MVLRNCLFTMAISSIFCASISPIIAADLPNETYDPYPGAYTVPPANWAGAYLGVMLGYNWGNFDPDSSFDVDADGFLIGGFGGYNFQSGALVFGAEVDLAMTSMDGSEGNADADVDWTGSLRGRIGYTFDRHLVYGTAGVAFAAADMDLGGPSEDNTHLGLTAGFGFESMLNRSVSARLEYLYTGYGEKDYSGFDADLSNHSIRTGLGYHF